MSLKIKEEVKKQFDVGFLVVRKMGGTNVHGLSEPKPSQSKG